MALRRWRHHPSRRLALQSGREACALQKQRAAGERNFLAAAGAFPNDPAWAGEAADASQAGLTSLFVYQLNHSTVVASHVNDASLASRMVCGTSLATKSPKSIPLAPGIAAKSAPARATSPLQRLWLVPRPRDSLITKIGSAPSAPAPRLRHGDEPVGPNIPVTTEVTAQNVNSTGFAFVTNPAHHVFDGTVNFRIGPATAGQVTMTVSVAANWVPWLRGNGIRNYIAKRAVARQEDQAWNQLESRVQKECQTITGDGLW
jgi:hypothetical protein